MKLSLAGIISLFKKGTIKKYFHKLITLQASPSKISFSIALGIFIGLLIPIGLQTVIAIPIAMMFGCNIILTTTATLITNPLTIFPIYFISIKIGEYFTSSNVSWEQLTLLFSDPSVENLLKLSKDGLTVFFVGSFILGLIISITVYAITLQMIKFYRTKHNIFHNELKKT